MYLGVAPHVGAWIETLFWSVNQDRSETSPLTEGRGLKQSYFELVAFQIKVAPHGGAWIETTRSIYQ